MSTHSSPQAWTIAERAARLRATRPSSPTHGETATQIERWRGSRSHLTPSDWNALLRLNDYDEPTIAHCVADDFPSHLDAHEEAPHWERLYERIMERPIDAERRTAETGYLAAFLPFLDYAQERIAVYARNCTLSVSEDALRTMNDAFALRLLHIGLKTLVLELNRERERGTLTGEDPQSRWNSYCALASTELYQRNLYARYPVMARFATIATRNYLDHVADYFARLGHCSDALASRLGLDGELRLDQVSMDGGDVHAHGRGVIITTINGARVVYKPRNLAVHDMFNDFAARLETEPDFLPLKPLWVIARDDYAFEEFVQYRECENEEAVRRYYRRYGQLIAMLWLLHGNDMHFENIIVDGEYPQIVDYETIVTATAKTADERISGAEVRVRDMIMQSIASGCMIPTAMSVGGSGGSIELSALMPGEQRFTGSVPTPVDLNTDHARYEIGENVLTKGPCLVRFDGAEVNPLDYGADIEQGFDAAIRAFKRLGVDGMREVLRDGDVPVRLLLRDTNSYARLLDFIRHPNELDDMRHVESILQNMYVFPFADKALCRSEYEQMLEGDVPMFVGRVGSCEILDPDGKRVSDSLKYAPATAILDTLEHLDEQAELQRALLRNALHRSDLDGSCVPADMLTTAQYPAAIAGALAEHGVVDQESGTVSWLTMPRLASLRDDLPYSGSASPQVASLALAEGSMAVAMLLMHLDMDDRDAALDATLDACLKTACDGQLQLQEMKSPFTTNTARLFLALTMKARHMRGARRFLQSSTRVIATQLAAYGAPSFPLRDERLAAGDVSYLTGVGSWLMLICRLCETMHDCAILEDAATFVNELQAVIRRLHDAEAQSEAAARQLKSAQGYAGLAVAFLELATLSRSRDHAAFAAQLWRWAVEAYDPQRDGAGWRCGAVGLLWAQHELESLDANFFEAYGVSRMFADKEAIAAMIGGVEANDDSVADGRSGCVDTLVSIYATTGDRWYLEQARTMLDTMIADAHERGGFAVNRISEFTDLSYLHGELGVAYTMLRVRNPEIPSLLALEVR